MHARTATDLENLVGIGKPERAGELAFHFSLAGPSPEMRSKALYHSLEAGRRAALLFSHREALHHFDTAASLANEVTGVDLATRAELVIQRARSARSLGLWVQSLTYARELQLLTDDVKLRAEGHEICGFALQQTFRMTEALEEYESGLKVLRGLDPEPVTDRGRLRIQQQQAPDLVHAGQRALPPCSRRRDAA